MASPLNRKMENIEGDTKYLSLEILQGNSSNLPAGDIFALGATVYELVCMSNVHRSDNEKVKMDRRLAEI